jgi:glutathione S-transferase
MVQFEIPKEFGYIIFIGVTLVFLLVYLGIKVGRARKHNGVSYPFGKICKVNFF